MIAYNIDAEPFKIIKCEMLQVLMSCNAGLEIILITKFNNARNFKLVCKKSVHGLQLLTSRYPKVWYDFFSHECCQPKNHMEATSNAPLFATDVML